jgi:phytoene desaturase (3,4-didehydrolycopene-forming)
LFTTSCCDVASFSVFAPIGGFQAVTSALESLAKDFGVTVQCNTTVVNITDNGVYFHQANRNKNDFLPADLILVNADLPYARKSLLMKENQRPSMNQRVKSSETFDWDDKFSFSSGVISFHWSLDKPLDDLNTHNVFLVAGSRPQAEASWTVLRLSDNGSDQNLDFDEDYPFNFYVHRASRSDPSAAPDGCDCIMVLVPCQTLERDEECAKLPRDEAIARYQQQFPDDFITKVKSAVLKRMASVATLADMEEHILHEVVDTPATWADQYNLAAGTPFALSHGFGQLSLTRPGPGSSGMKNVLYCGASTRPGNGVPLVLIGAKQVAEKANTILDRRKQEMDLEVFVENHRRGS